MSENLENKKLIVANVSEELAKTGDKEGQASTVVFNYSTIDSNEMNALRTKLFEQNASLRVVKNTLIKIVLESMGVKVEKDFTGQNAVLLHDGEDFVSTVKELFAFIKESDKGEISLGVLNNAVISQGEIEALSKLPSKEVLIGQVVAGFASPIRGFAVTLNGVQTQFTRVLSEIKNQKS